jgi:hypothetical protein
MHTSRSELIDCTTHRPIANRSTQPTSWVHVSPSHPGAEQAVFFSFLFLLS